MAITFDEVSTGTTVKRWTHRVPDEPVVEIQFSLNQADNKSSVQIRISGATGPAQVNTVLQIIQNKISSVFGV